MRKAVLLVPLGALVLLLALGLAGCGDNSSSSDSESGSSGGATTSQDTANAALCSSLSDLQEAGNDLKSLDPKDTTLTQLSTTAAGLGAAWTAVKAAAANAKDIDTAALSDSWDGVKAALTAIPGSGTSPSAAVESVTSALEPLQQAADDLKPQCEGATTTGATTS